VREGEGKSIFPVVAIWRFSKNNCASVARISAEAATGRTEHNKKDEVCIFSARKGNV
jgi:hypothetical protein